MLFVKMVLIIIIMINNEAIVNKFWLFGDKFMPEIHSKQAVVLGKLRIT